MCLHLRGTIDKVKVKQELEDFGRKFRFMWYFRNDGKTFDNNKKCRPKPTFNPKKQGRHYRSISKLLRRETSRF